MKRAFIIIGIVVVLVVVGVSAYFFLCYPERSSSPVAVTENPVVSVPSEQAAKSDLWVQPKEVRYAEDAGRILYMDGDSLMLFDVVSREKRVLVIDKTIINYDISHDGKKVVYARYADNYLPFATISIFDTESEKVAELEPERGAISESGPVFFPDASKIAYIRRTFDETDTPSDGEIWMLNIATGKRRHLVGDDSRSMIDISKLDKNIVGGHWDGTYFCIGNDEIIGPKMKVGSISADGRHFSYLRSEWAPECSGLGGRSFSVNMDGSEFLASKFMRDYGVANVEYNGKRVRSNWYYLSVLAWFKDGSFVVRKNFLPPMGDEALAIYDKNQREKYVFYDTTKGSKWVVYVYNVKLLSDSAFLALYRDLSSGRTLLKRMDFNDASSLDLSQGGRVVKLDEPKAGTIMGHKIINENTISYIRAAGNHSELFVYDVSSGKEESLGQLN